jgi:hypothetical protein
VLLIGRLPWAANEAGGGVRAKSPKKVWPPVRNARGRHPGKSVELNRHRAAGWWSDFILPRAIGLMAALVLSSCAHSPLVWDYYDQCALQIPSFPAMADVGDKSV